MSATEIPKESTLNPPTGSTELAKLRALIADDGFAATFQTMGRYRTALLQIASALARSPAQNTDAVVTDHSVDVDKMVPQGGPGADERAAFEAAYVAHMNSHEINWAWGQRDYTVEEIAVKREDEFYNVGIAGVGQYSGYLNGCWWGWQNAPRTAQSGQRAGVALLADEHKGMRVDYQGLLKQARAALRLEPCLAEMLRQLQDHVTELGRRWYGGDTAVVDELLQLYCVEREARAAVAAAPTQ